MKMGGGGGVVRASATQSEWTRLAQAVTRYSSRATCRTRMLLVVGYSEFDAWFLSLFDISQVQLVLPFSLLLAVANWPSNVSQCV